MVLSQKFAFLLIIAVSWSLLSGCGEGPFSDLSTSELQSRYSECDTENMAPGTAITCDNIRRECERRARQKGRKVCF